MGKKVAVIGSGFAGMAAATVLANAKYNVTIFEKNSSPGGRARKFSIDGFSFDMGPSWYWMPDVFEKYFNRFGYSVHELYSLKRLDPSYKVVFDGESWEIPAGRRELSELFERVEAGSAIKLDKFLEEAHFKYDVGIKDLVYKPGKSLTEFFDWRLISGIFKLQVFSSISSHIRHYFKDPRLIRLLEFPVLFLGAMPSKTPALYSLMNYADMVLGTWFPMGGMYKIVEAMEDVAREKGVEFRYNEEVTDLTIEGRNIRSLTTSTGPHSFDLLIAAADYHHVEQHLLPVDYRQYSPAYWDRRKLAPSSVIFYLGIDCPVPKLSHHTLFFDRDFDKHSREIYSQPAWPEQPLFYVCCSTKTDTSLAPKSMENMFILIPVAPGLRDTAQIKEFYFNHIMKRLEQFTGVALRDHIVYQRSYAHSDFELDYHAFKGNAYGLANTLSQTAVLKPAMTSSKLDNLFYTGQLTVPGPGVPPSLISGQVAAHEVEKKYMQT